MLKGQTNTFYYNYLAEKIYNFNRIIYKLKYYFKTEENKYQYMSEWRETTFLRIITTNLSISWLNCL